MSKKTVHAVASAMFTYALWGKLPPPIHNYHPAPSKERDCLLPGCEVRHTHNGGYCCADHCKQHRELREVSNG